jgi:hypothetical protein
VFFLVVARRRVSKQKKKVGQEQAQALVFVRADGD